MGPTTIHGLPAHVLLVHIVVVFAPLSALLLALSVLWPAARRKLGFLTPLVALVTLVFVPITTHAGSWLIKRTQGAPVLYHHAHLGHQMIYWSAAVFGLSTLWWLLHHEHVAGRLPVAARHPVTKALLAGLSVAAAVGSAIWIYRIGDSGAQSVWAS
jgi:hypothetical protein